MAHRQFTVKWITLFIFTLSHLIPYDGSARASRRIQDSKSQKAKASRASNIKTKKNADLDGSGVQNQVSPDGKGGTVTTTVGGLASGGATGAVAGTGSPAIAVTAGSPGVGIPSAGRAAGDSGGVMLLGYTPTPTPSPTPSQAQNTGMQMAAALAGALASLFGGGGGGGQNKNASNRAGGGGSGGGLSSTPASDDTRAPSASAGSVSAPAEKPAEEPDGKPGDTPETMAPEQEPPKLPQDPPTKPDAKPQDLSAQCRETGARSVDDDGFHVPQKPSDMIVYLCDEQTRIEGTMTPAEASKINPLMEKRYDVPFVQVTEIRNLKSSPIHPVARGTISGQPDCKTDSLLPAEKICKITIKHNKCPMGVENTTCFSHYFDVIIPKNNIPSDGQEVLPCKFLGRTSDLQQIATTTGSTRPVTRASSKFYMTSGEGAAYSKAVVPFAGFKKWEEVVKGSKEYAQKINEGIDPDKTYEARFCQTAEKIKKEAKDLKPGEKLVPAAEKSAPSFQSTPKSDKLQVRPAVK